MSVEPTKQTLLSLADAWAAVVIGRQVQDAAYRGNRVTAQRRIAAVLVRQRGDRRLVGVHMSPIGQPPSFAPP